MLNRLNIRLLLVLVLLFLFLPAITMGIGEGRDEPVDEPALSRRAKTALVIGNADYKSSPLDNPVNDAEDIEKKLSGYGFDVTLITNAGKRKIERAIRSFGKKLRKGGVGLFYYAGHGIQIEGVNYLIPIGAILESEIDARYEGVDANLILGKMKDAENELNIVLLDACRNNPFIKNMRSARVGLARMNAPSGSIIAYATSPGKVALDGRKGRNSVFTKNLLKNMSIPGLTIENILKNTRIAVIKATNKNQVPWESSSLTTNFRFQTIDPPTPRPRADAPSKKGENIEVSYWKAIKDLHEKVVFQEYLNKFPDGIFKELALIKIAVYDHKKNEQETNEAQHQQNLALLKKRRGQVKNEREKFASFYQAILSESKKCHHETKTLLSRYTSLEPADNQLRSLKKQLLDHTRKFAGGEQEILNKARTIQAQNLAFKTKEKKLRGLNKKTPTEEETLNLELQNAVSEYNQLQSDNAALQLIKQQLQLQTARAQLKDTKLWQKYNEQLPAHLQSQIRRQKRAKKKLPSLEEKEDPVTKTDYSLSLAIFPFNSLGEDSDSSLCRVITELAEKMAHIRIAMSYYDSQYVTGKNIFYPTEQQKHELKNQCWKKASLFSGRKMNISFIKEYAAENHIDLVLLYSYDAKAEERNTNEMGWASASLIDLSDENEKVISLKSEVQFNHLEGYNEIMKLTKQLFSRFQP